MQDFKSLNKIVFSLFFLSQGFTSLTQNLVPNPSFEDFINCPINSGEIDSARYWYSCLNSPDYFNTCTNKTKGFYNVPLNYVGNQVPFHGSSYAGLITYYKTIIDSSKFYDNARELIGIKLSQKLIVGKKYYASIYISSTYNLDFDTIVCSTNKFGFRFSTKYYKPDSIDNYANIYFDKIVDDTVNWIRLSGSFIADSAYEYLSIGNHYFGKNTNVINHSNFQNIMAYYYVDMVSVTTDSLIDPRSELSETRIDKSVSVYPSPVVDRLHIEHTEHNPVEYSIYDMVGTLVLRGYTHGDIDVSRLDEGSYFIQLYSDSETYETKRFEVRR